MESPKHSEIAVHLFYYKPMSYYSSERMNHYDHLNSAQQTTIKYVWRKSYFQ